jgi:hypothetical protein
MDYYRLIDAAKDDRTYDVIEMSKRLGFLNGEESKEYTETHC